MLVSKYFIKMRCLCSLRFGRCIYFYVLDTLIIDHIRNEILPNADKLPREFMHRIIDILNRGSINTSKCNAYLCSTRQFLCHSKKTMSELKVTSLHEAIKKKSANERRVVA